MSSRAFNFRVDDRGCFAQGHPGSSRQRVSLMLSLGAWDKAHDLYVALTPAEARAMAVALEAAATHAENVLPTGLGESAVDASAVAS